jgi:hypothetical protein
MAERPIGRKVEEMRWVAAISKAAVWYSRAGDSKRILQAMAAPRSASRARMRERAFGWYRERPASLVSTEAMLREGRTAGRASCHTAALLAATLMEYE